MKSYISDITEMFNRNGTWKMDVSEWQNVSVQIIGQTEPVNILGSNDANAITSVSDGNAVSSINYSAIQAVNLSDGSTVTSIPDENLYSIKIVFKFLELQGGTATKVLLFFNKPY